MTDIDNVFTALFDALLDSPYDKLLLYAGERPKFQKARYSGPVSDFKVIDSDEMAYDLETLGITKEGKTLKEFFTWTYNREGKEPEILRMKYTRWDKDLRLIVYRPGVNILDLAAKEFLPWK